MHLVQPHIVWHSIHCVRNEASLSVEPQDPGLFSNPVVSHIFDGQIMGLRNRYSNSDKTEEHRSGYE